MSIKSITLDELRRMNDKEGLILQGCGGDPQEWIDIINKDLTDAGVLKNGSKFVDVDRFKWERRTCLLFHLDNIDLDLGKLAMWRLQTHGLFGGTWVSDFVPNRLGGFITEDTPKQEKPDCPLIGQDGNIFNLMGIAARTLRQHDLAGQAKEMSDRIYASGSYDEALSIIGEYVNITSTDEDEGVATDDTEQDPMGGISY